VTHRATLALLALPGALMLAAAGCTQTCTLIGCPDQNQIDLVDADGEPTLARGEVAAPDSRDALAFDCTIPSSPCDDTGTLRLDSLIAPDGLSTFRVRFELADGSFTAWQEVELELEEVTDPDFNGPGCSCTWNEGRGTLAVPADAQLGPASLPDGGA